MDKVEQQIRDLVKWENGYSYSKPNQVAIDKALDIYAIALKQEIKCDATIGNSIHLLFFFDIKRRIFVCVDTRNDGTFDARYKIGVVAKYETVDEDENCPEKDLIEKFRLLKYIK